MVGAGSWGTALALHACRAGHRVRLWARRSSHAAQMAARRENPTYLQGFELPGDLKVTADAQEALARASLVVSAVPSRFLRRIWRELAPALPGGAHLVSATKGLEEGTGYRMTEVLREEVGGGLASVSALSGPSFARELAEGHPTAVALGCPEPTAAAELQRQLSHGPLRVYRNADIVGVEHGGALKNVIALAAGIVDGLGLGTNTRAALVCRGLKEVADLATARGARRETLMGLSGLGDLVLTCTGPLSRNRRVGMELAEGRPLADVESGTRMVAEGVVTVRAARQLARRHGVGMPITDQVHAILYEGKEPRAAIEELMARRLVEE